MRSHTDIVQRLVERMMRQPLPQVSLAALLEGHLDFRERPDYEHPLQPLFFAVFVANSVDLGLIDLDNLYVAGDGTKLTTWANPHGKKLCTCDNRGQRPDDHCLCHRAYHDPLARWGWDSYRYTYPKENYRLHTLIPRDSLFWQLHRDARSCAERSVKRKKCDFHLRETRTAGRARWFFRAILAAMCQHIDAWLLHAADRLT